jgi:ABC-type molybdenum transport system ATPase subunit/photorepair protein PhrA
MLTRLLSFSDAFRYCDSPSSESLREHTGARLLLISTSMLCRSFDGDPAVEDLSFEIPEGNLFTLLGPNGAGKTTTNRRSLQQFATERYSDSSI